MKDIFIMLQKWVSLLFIAIALIPTSGQAQHQKNKETIVKDLVESNNYIFKAQTALPTSSRIRQLTSDYDLRVSKDTVISYLPYFGRAYTAPIDPSQGPLNFTSTNFQYTIANKKKGGWDITIIPKDIRDPRQMVLSIFDNGTASLSVTSNDRQPISFNGYVTARK